VIGEAEADRFFLQSRVSDGQRLPVQFGEFGMHAAVEVDGGFGDARRPRRRLRVAGRGEMFEEGFLAFYREADVGAAPALPEAAVGGGMAEFALPSPPSTPPRTGRRFVPFGISAGTAFSGRLFGQRRCPIRPERGIAAARAVKAGEAESGFVRRILAPGAGAQGGEEGGLRRGVDGTLRRARIVFSIHP
jgi:hypothetical protein